jgi:transcriptional regulator with XRE-family HTH domain
VVTKNQFLEWLQARRAAGETLTAIGESLGASGVSASLWLSGKRNPSPMALTLAEHLMRQPVEMAPGLPGAAGSVAGKSKGGVR